MALKKNEMFCNSYCRYEMINGENCRMQKRINLGEGVEETTERGTKKGGE